jgi:hypothetical protein
MNFRLWLNLSLISRTNLGPIFQLLEIDMNAAIAWLLPRASTTSIASIESLVTIALFSGVGLLLSLSVLILDQNIPGEWFWSIIAVCGPPMAFSLRFAQSASAMWKTWDELPFREDERPQRSASMLARPPLKESPAAVRVQRRPHQTARR